MPGSEEQDRLLGSEEQQLYGTADLPAAEAAHLSEDEVTKREKTFFELALQIFPMLVGTICANMDTAIVMASYPAVGNDLKGLKETAWLSTGYMVTMTSFQPLYGKLCDIFGRKPCLLAAYTVFGLGALGCGMSRNMTQLIIARSFAGIGGGGMSTVASILISDMVPLRTRGTWHGRSAFLKVTSSAGPIIGGPLGGLLADTIGWRWSFFFQVALASCAFATVSLFLQVASSDRGMLFVNLKRVDLAGSICLVISLAALLIGLNSGGDIGWSKPRTIWALVLFIIFLALFVTVEGGVVRELVAPRHTITNPSLLPIYLSNFAARGCSLCIPFFISLYIQAVQKRSSTKAGFALLPSSFGDILGTVAGASLIQLTGRIWWLAVGAHGIMLLGALVVTISTVIPLNNAILSTGLAIGLLLVQVGRGCAMTSTLVALVAKSQQESVAVATAVMYLFRSLGSVVSLAVESALFQQNLQIILRKRLPSEDQDEIIARVRESLSYIDKLPAAAGIIVRGAYAKALELAFVLCCILAVSALICSFGIREEHISRPSHLESSRSRSRQTSGW